MHGLPRSLTSVVLAFLLVSRCTADGEELRPYSGHHGPKLRRNRDVQACQGVKYGNTTHSLHASPSVFNGSMPLFEAKHLVRDVGDYYYNKRQVYIRYQQVNFPLQTLSVLEPGGPGGCNGPNDSVRATVADSARVGQCLLAANAGFFNTHTGQCLGNVVSDGFLVQDSGGIQNAHFGITKDGQIFTGFLSELDLIVLKFQQLVGGVIWLVREGESYVEESIKMECSDTEETGTLQQFVEVLSARTAVGHDKDGRVIMVQVTGKTPANGVSLGEFADLLVTLGLVNAVNLDGGGSATVLINHTLVNFPSDACPDKVFNCERKVSTVLCVHEPLCSPPDCGGHGSCVRGQCRCQALWTGKSCDTLKCPNDCSHHGSCSEGGCLCRGGWQGENCSEPCPPAMWGHGCRERCWCQNGGLCDPSTGHCQCQPGFTGTFCEKECPFGFYGDGCSRMCLCTDGCFCHPVNGSCNSSHTSELQDSVTKMGQCLAKEEIRSHNLVPDQSAQISQLLTAVVGLGVVAALSLAANLAALGLFLKHRWRHRSPQARSPRRSTTKFVFHSDDGDDEDLMESDGSEEHIALVNAKNHVNR